MRWNWKQAVGSMVAVLVGCGSPGTPDAAVQDGGLAYDARSLGDAGSEPCTTRGMTETLSCGMCGTQTRFCTSAMTWEYSDCTGEHGVCEAGTTMDVACGPGGTVSSRCNDQCVYVADGECSTPLWSCGTPLVAESREGMVSVSSDTSAGAPGPLDLGATCGPPIADAATRPAQVVVSYVVPGTGSRVVSFTTANDATPTNFDTLIQVRRDCMAVPTVREGSCFDDGVPPSTPPLPTPDFRTVGSLVAMGGETLFFVVTGFGMVPPMSMTNVNEGPFQLDISVSDPTVPTLTAASLRSVIDGVATMVELSVTGADAGADVQGAWVTLLDGTGAAIDRNMDGMVDRLDDVSVGLGVNGMATFDTTATDFVLGDAITATSATRARVRLYDLAGSESTALTVDIVSARRVGYGEVCDDMNVCATSLVCTTGTCRATPETIAACAAATTLSLTGTPASATVTAMLAAGPSVVARPMGFGCAASGAPTLYDLTVPAGAFDLIASTVNDGTVGTLDTAIFIVAECENPTVAPDPPCADDDGTEHRARLVVQNIAAGSYTLGVSTFAPLVDPTTAQLDVTLRPVLATGATCDPMEIANRCAAGPCPAGGTCP